MRLWQEIHSGRTAGAMGLAPVSWQDRHYYCQETGERLSPDDWAAVKVIDDEYISSCAAAMERLSKAKAKS